MTTKPTHTPGSEIKTVREWLMELPDGVRDKAIKNAESEEEPSLDLHEVSLAGSILGSFTWSSSPEGQLYWKDQCRAAARGKAVES